MEDFHFAEDSCNHSKSHQHPLAMMTMCMNGPQDSAPVLGMAQAAPIDFGHNQYPWRVMVDRPKNPLDQTGFHHLPPSKDALWRSTTTPRRSLNTRGSTPRAETPRTARQHEADPKGWGLTKFKRYMNSTRILHGHGGSSSMFTQ